MCSSLFLRSWTGGLYRRLLMDQAGLYVLWIPWPADHARIDSADAHAQLSAVAGRHFASIGLNEFRGVHLHIGVQLALGESHRIEPAFCHAEVLGGQLPTAAHGHAVAGRPFSCREK